MNEFKGKKTAHDLWRTESNLPLRLAVWWRLFGPRKLKLLWAVPVALAVALMTVGVPSGESGPAMEARLGNPQLTVVDSSWPLPASAWARAGTPAGLQLVDTTTLAVQGLPVNPAAVSDMVIAQRTNAAEVRLWWGNSKVPQ